MLFTPHSGFEARFLFYILAITARILDACALSIYMQ